MNVYYCKLTSVNTVWLDGHLLYCKQEASFLHVIFLKNLSCVNNPTSKHMAPSVAM